MKTELRRWMFGGAVGFFALLAVLTQLALEWRLSDEKSAKKMVGGSRALTPTSTPASAEDPLGKALEVLEALGPNDALQLQRAQQNLLDEARRSLSRFHEHFNHRLDAIEETPTHRALILAEVFFATAEESHWSCVARFLERDDDSNRSATVANLRMHFLDRLRRQPPGRRAAPLLVPALTRLVAHHGDLNVARRAAEAFLALHAPDQRDRARTHLRQTVRRRPNAEQLAFADLL